MLMDRNTNSCGATSKIDVVRPSPRAEPDKDKDKEALFNVAYF